MRTPALAATVGGLVLLMAACTTASDDPGSTLTTTPMSTTSTSTTAPATSTTPPTTSTTPISSTTEPTTTTIVDATTTTATMPSGGPFHPLVPIRLAPPDPLPGSDGASGSGCSPGSDTLPDGVWFVFAVERRSDAVVGDLACFWFGDIAYEVGEAAGEEVENEFYIGNDSERLRTTEVATGAVVWTLAGDTTDGHSAIEYADWLGAGSTYVDCPGDFCTIWLFVNDGLITDIVEQYIP